MRKLTQLEFLEKVIQIHGNLYDYSNTIYINSRELIEIKCNIHGTFWQKANNHLNGQGCPKCTKYSGYSQEDWINTANKVHNFKYDYSKSIRNGNEKICIICPEHGEFWQISGSHLQGCGCIKCSGKYLSNNEEFINKSNIIHNFKYIYNKVNYINNKTKVIITCPKHTDFEQTPTDHLRGRGCPKCSTSKRELLINNWLKENNIPFKTQVKLKMNTLCKKSNIIYIDFFIRYNNKSFIIEYDGEQHFKYIPFFHRGGIIDFENQQRRDIILEEFCELHNDKITFLKFNFKQTDNEIMNILNIKIKNNAKF